MIHRPSTTNRSENQNVNVTLLKPASKKAKQTIIATLLISSSAFAQQPFSAAGTAQPPPSAPQPASSTTCEPNLFQKFFDGKIPDAIANGKLNVDVRARFEYAHETGVPAIKDPSYAPTVRTRIGYTTADLYGFQGMVEGQNVSVIGSEGNYNAAGSNHKGYKPVIGDPPLTRLDQAWLGYHYEDYVAAKAGQQHLTLDNHRFIGDSAWRQNWQTYDAASIGSQPITNLHLFYSYVWDVHRVYGNVAGLPAANQDFSSDSHLINISYDGWKYGRFVGYTYLLDLTNAAGAANSCATYGGYFAGAAPITEKISVDYRAEYAWQTDYGDTPLRYHTGYYNLEAGATMNPVSIGAGYENMGSAINTGKGGGRTSFRTPLATFHAFDWADVFTSTPTNGLQNIYGYAQVGLPADVPLRVIYHKWDATHGDADFGNEFDVMASKKFGKHWNALLEYAYYIGNDAGAPTVAANMKLQRFWAQLEFKY